MIIILIFINTIIIMPHKYNTRIKSGALTPFLYIGDNNDDDADDDYEDDSYRGRYRGRCLVPYITVNDDDDTNSSSSKDNNSTSESSDSDDSEKNFPNKKKNATKLNKCSYYKFLSELYPSNYSKNKYIDEIKKTITNKEFSNKRHKKSDSKFVTSPCNSTNSFNNKIIKKSRKISKKKKLTNYNYLDDENNIKTDDDNNDDNDYDDDAKYEKSLLTHGFKKMFDNINGSDKNINIILNLKKGTNTIYNNESNNSDQMLGNSLLPTMYYVKNKYHNEEDDENNEDNEDDEDNEDNEDDEDDTNEQEKHKNKSKKNKNVKKENITMNNEDTNVPAPQKISNKNYKKFEKILNNEEKESEYFKKCLSANLQLEAIAKLEKLKELTTISKPYLLHLVDLDIPDQYKACALRKINTMRSMGNYGNSEYYKIKSWVDAFLKIPFNKYNNLPISFADGIEQCHDFMENSKKILDSVTYGLEDAKIQIMQMIGLWLVNPNAVGCAIAIKGPPGTGKTTLIKEGISKILNRPFALVALGGCGDSGFLDGFDYTYEGSKHGKIIDILIQCGCMNPIILFDELDKLSDSFKGQEITGVLTHLTDSTQNTKFSDKYFSEISINMSKALFIFSYNDEAMVNPILKDRMYKIETKGYKTKDKLIIAKDYLLPKIRDEIKFDSTSIVFSDEILEYIINDFTEKEDGVRNLKRCLEIVYKKLNLYRLMKPDINLFENSEGLKLKNKITFPCILTKQMIDDLINKGSTKDIPYGMYV
jgi:ATP-dependent Lon protease